MLHHFKGKRPSTRDVLSYPMAFEIHFLTFVLVLKLVEYSDTSQEKKKRRKRKERRKESNKNICVFKWSQKHQLPPMTITRCFIHLGDVLGWKAQAPAGTSAMAPWKGRTTFDEASGAVIDLCHSEHQALVNKKATDKIIWLMAKVESQYK